MHINRKNVLIASCLALVVSLGIAAYFLVGHNGSDNGKLDITQTSQMESSTPKIDMSPGTSEDNESSTQKKEADPSASPAAPVSKLSVVITRANQDSDGMVRVRGLVFGTTSGTCKVILSMSEQSLTKSSAVVLQTNSYTCGQIDIPTSELGPGEWSVYLIINSSGLEAKSEPQKIIVQ